MLYRAAVFAEDVVQCKGGVEEAGKLSPQYPKLTPVDPWVAVFVRCAEVLVRA